MVTLSFRTVIAPYPEILTAGRDAIDQIQAYKGYSQFAYCRSTISNLIILALDSDQQIVGYLLGAIYGQNLSRTGQWSFGENRYRSCWIDYVTVDEKYRKQGIARQLVSQAEEYFVAHQDLIPAGSKDNIYLVAVREAINFWVKLGWEVIVTEDHKDDVDYPGVYAAEIGQWMAKAVMTPVIMDEQRFFESYADHIVESYADLGLDGAEHLPLNLYRQNFQNPLNNVFDLMTGLAATYPLDALKRVYDKLLLVASEFEVTKLTKNTLVASSFDPRYLGNNQDAQAIWAWARETFPAE